MSEPEAVRTEAQGQVLSLLHKLKRGFDREESFRLLFRIYYPRIRGSFSHIVPPEERKDLTQEVFLRIHRGLESCPGDVAGFERWLFTVAHNVFLSWLQKSQRLKRRGWEVPLSSTHEEDAGEPEIKDPREPLRGAALKRLLEEERARLLHQAIGKMPEQMRACVMLRVGQDRSYGEIASLLGLAEGTVKAHLHRARVWLRTALGSYFEDFEL